MSRILRESSLPISAAAAPAAGHTARTPRRRKPSTPVVSVGLGGLKPAQTQHEPAGVRPLTPGRKPGTKQRLYRLRRELGRISPAPSDPHEARSAIVEAMVRAGLSGWAVPALADDATVHHADGSLEIALITHAIIFNPGGAFRIADLYPPVSVYFEMPGHDGDVFVAPASADGAGGSSRRLVAGARRKAGSV